MMTNNDRLKTLLGYSIPSIIAMILSTTLTLTDGYFVGNYVGEKALASINLGLPILYLYLGLGLCIGVGGSVISGQLIGRKDRDKASSVFTESIVTALAITLLLSAGVYLLFNPILRLLKAEGELSVFFKSYYRVMLFSYPLLVLTTIFGMFIRTDGRPQVFMGISLLESVLNFILDYVFLKKLNMGVKGSAYATLIVKVVSCTICILYFLFSSKNIKIKRFSFDCAVFQQSMLNGSSEFIGEMAGAISMMALNYVLMKYVGEGGVAAFTILGFAVYGYNMITIGFGQGLSPIVSVLWGKNEREEAVVMRRLASNILFVLGLITALIFFFFGKNFASIFGAGEECALSVSRGFKIFSLTFVFMGYDVIASMYFTSISDPLSSAIISLLRGLVLLLLFTFLFPYLWGMDGVWAVSPTTEVLTAIVAFSLIRRENNKG